MKVITRKLLLIVLLAAACLGLVYVAAGRPLIRFAYEERLPGALDFLERQLAGRDVHPLAHYLSAADRLFAVALAAGALLVLLVRFAAVRRREVLLALVSAAACFVLVDLSLRLFIEPTPHASGTLFGRELPPFTVIPYELIPSPEERREDFRTKTPFLSAAGDSLTYEDLSGRKREDPDLEHTLMENTRSPCGWFIINSIGARDEREFAKGVPEGKFRVLAFGDSYAAGEQLPQWETWTRRLEERGDSLEVINFGSPGFGMGQSYRFFLRIREKLDCDLALMNFVPFADLYRDVNVLRYLPNRWHSYKPLARYVVEDGELRLVRSPYRDLADMLAKNPDGPSEELLDHLERYDPFFLREYYENSLLLRCSVFYRLFRSHQYQKEKGAVFAAVHRPDSEAMRVSLAIFEAMNEAAGKDGAELMVVLHPAEYGAAAYREGKGFHDNWDGISRALEDRPYRFLDLMPFFLELPESEIDAGIDGTHYGPKLAEHVAEALWTEIEPMVRRDAD